jgi:hypothetical protein
MELPKIIKDVGFEFSWDEPKTWALNVPVEEIPITDLSWHFSVPFWFKPGGKYDLTPQEVLDNPQQFAQEYERIQNSDISHPLDIMLWKDKWLLLDGLHRLVKLHLQGQTVVKVRKIPHKDIPNILTEPLANSASWITSKAQIKVSPISGKGLFAKEDINPGEVVVVWHGTYADKIGAEQAKKNNKLVMQWDDDLFSIEDRGDDDGYFINHACDSSLWMEDAFSLIARRSIKMGEEITADYALWEADENYISKWECGCGSIDCRKKITGKDWRIKTVQEKYKDHFSPLINKRIKSL